MNWAPWHLNCSKENLAVRLFAGANRHVFLSGLLNCLCLHPFGPDFLEKMAAQTGRGMFCSLHDVKQTLLERMM